MKDTLNTINYGIIRIVKDEKYLKAQEYETVEGSDGETYCIRLTENNIIVAVLIEEKMTMEEERDYMNSVWESYHSSDYDDNEEAYIDHRTGCDGGYMGEDEE